MNGPGERARLALAELVGLLEDAEVPAALDPSDVHVGDDGGAWVHLVALRPLSLSGAWQADAAVYVLARDTDTTEVLTDLGDMLDAALTVCAELLHPDEDITTESLDLPGGGSGLPAYRIPVQLDI